MSQCFRLVNAGFVDKVIVFDELPKRLLQGIKTREVAGFPRAWARWLASIGSVRDILKTETSRSPTMEWIFKYSVIGKEPCFYILEYLDLNADKDAWRQISEYLRMNVGPNVRLKEKIEDMAVAFAPDPKAQLEIEPEDVPVIPIPPEREIVENPKELVKPGEIIQVEESIPQPKKRGRPKKGIAVGV